jgi:hypothetical protein
VIQRKRAAEHGEVPYRHAGGPVLSYLEWNFLPMGLANGVERFYHDACRSPHHRVSACAQMLAATIPTAKRAEDSRIECTPC